VPSQALAGLRELARALAAAGTAAALEEAIDRATRTLLGALKTTLCLSPAVALAPAALASPPARTPGPPPGRSPEAEALATGRPLWLTPADLETRWPDHRGKEPAAALAVLPLRDGADALGALSVALLELPAEAADARALLETIAALAALGVGTLRASAAAGDGKATEARLERALAERDEFLSIASHELNTPLTVLQLNVQSLRRRLERDPEAVTRARLANTLDAVARQVTRLAQLLSYLLDVSRVRTRRLFLDREAFDLCQMVRETVARTNALASARGAQFVMHGCAPVIGYWDRLRMEQVLSNLLTNAIKYGLGKPIEVSVAAEGDTATVTVADQGVGIATADRERIFERFERATNLEHADSLGLGLYITKEIVAAHGGRLEVDSELGRGSIFRVRLPLHRLSDEPERERDAKSQRRP
jgi:signal transduction histidine kinase